MNNAPHNQTNGNPPPEDDPRVTAYALGELAGEDAAAMERLVGGDAKVQRDPRSWRFAARRLCRRTGGDADRDAARRDHAPAV